MPNHFHIALMERAESGISLFMQKVMTGYTMYFNKKHDRTGSLFAGTFKSKHIDSDRYFKHLVSYIHLNPAELTDTEWKNGRASVNHIKNALASFPHSSLLDYEGITRAENAILSGELNSLYEEKPRLQEIISSAHEYYQQNLSEV